MIKDRTRKERKWHKAGSRNLGCIRSSEMCIYQMTSLPCGVFCAYIFLSLLFLSYSPLLQEKEIKANAS